MQQYITTARTFAIAHKKKIILGSEIALGLAILTIAALLFLYNVPKNTHQVVKACDLFTPAEAQDLLGDKVMSLNSNEPTISDDMATSKCSYTDNNPDKDKMKVAAIAVRAGTSSKAVQQNKTEFAAGRPSKGTKTVKNLGDSAYFNKSVGQLNILDGSKWIILSYGVGATPQDNTLDQATDLAKKVLN